MSESVSSIEGNKVVSSFSDATNAHLQEVVMDILLTCIWGSPFGMFLIVILSVLIAMFILVRLNIRVEIIPPYLPFAIAVLFGLVLAAFPQYAVYLFPIGAAFLGILVAVYLYTKAIIVREEKEETEEEEEKE